MPQYHICVVTNSQWEGPRTPRQPSQPRAYNSARHLGYTSPRLPDPWTSTYPGRQSSKGFLRSSLPPLTLTHAHWHPVAAADNCRWCTTTHATHRIDAQAHIFSGHSDFAGHSCDLDPLDQTPLQLGCRQWFRQIAHTALYVVSVGSIPEHYAAPASNSYDEHTRCLSRRWLKKVDETTAALWHDFIRLHRDRGKTQ